MAVKLGSKENKKNMDRRWLASKYRNNRIYPVLVIFLLLTGFLSLSGYLIYSNIHELTLELLKKNAMNVAATTAKVVEQDIESYVTLTNVTDYEQEDYDEGYYNKMQQTFQEIKNETGASFIYTEKKLTGTEIAYIFDGEDPKSELFSPIGSVDNMGEIELMAYNKEVTVATDIVDWDYWGELLTGCSPIIDHRTGDVLGLVGVDFSLDYLNNLMERIRIIIAVFVTLIILLSTFLIYKLHGDKYTALNIDYLTRLHSKRYHDVKLNELIEKVRISKKPLSLMMIDMDNFKQINDQYGHDMGDNILRYGAQRIETLTRNNDICSRFGGDEFIVILPDANLEQAKMIGERLIEKFNNNDSVKEKTIIDDLDITLSIGVAELQDDMNERELTQCADEALYISKYKGKNRISAFGETKQGTCL